MSFSFSIVNNNIQSFPFCGFANKDIVIFTTGKIASSYLHGFTPGNDTIFVLSDLNFNYKIEHTPKINDINRDYITTFTNDLEKILKHKKIDKRFVLFVRNPMKRMIGAFIEDYWTDEVKNEEKIKNILKDESTAEVSKLLNEISNLKKIPITNNIALIKKVAAHLLKEYIEKSLYKEGHDSNWLLFVYELKNIFKDRVDVLDIDDVDLHEKLNPFIDDLDSKKINSHKDLSNIIDNIDDDDIIFKLKKIYFNEVEIYNKLKWRYQDTNIALT